MSKGTPQPVPAAPAPGQPDHIETERSDLFPDSPNADQSNIVDGKHHTKQAPEDDHDPAHQPSRKELADERGGHGHSGNNHVARNGSRK
jgi:hypothetical protein